VLSLDEATAIHDGNWRVPEGWRQGRGAWGGLVVAAVVRAAQESDRATEGHRPLREVSLHIVGPVPAGDVSITATLVRRGSATGIWQVSVGADEVWATATVVFGADRATDVTGRPVLHMPEVTAWADLEPLTLGPPLAPEFLQHLAVRPLSGYPYSDTADEVVAWVAPAIPIAAYDEATLVGMVDAMWPAALVQVSTPRPMATLSFSATLLVDPATVDPAEPLLHRGRLLALSAGYATETRELWTSDGRLAVHNTQGITIIR